MNPAFNSLPRRNIIVDAAADQGPLEHWRHAQGVGGINTLPLPPRTIDGVAAFKPRLIRIFVQEFFQFYPQHGRFDWSKLDPYMASMAATGATVVAALAIKPNPLYPKIDHSIWKPNSVEEWQKVIAAVVKRYSVEKKIVTHWEFGNEVDIGEWGGCPFLIKDPMEYAEYYEMTVKPILETFPGAKVGGPALAGFDKNYLATLMDHCKRKQLPLDFISWHLYNDDPAKHAGLVEKAKAVIAEHAPLKPEMMVTEWSKMFDQVSVEDLAFSSRQSANIAAILMAYVDSGVDGTNFYHCIDQVAYPEEFAPFFKDPRIMTEHWNEIPHRFGCFGVNQEVRPQYFVFQMLSRLGERRISAISDEPALRVLAAKDGKRLSVMIANFDLQQSRDFIATVKFPTSGGSRKKLKMWRIDAGRRWNEEKLELLPVEQREVVSEAGFRCQFYCPADSVLMVELDG